MKGIRNGVKARLWASRNTIASVVIGPLRMMSTEDMISIGGRPIHGKQGEKERSL